VAIIIPDNFFMCNYKADQYMQIAPKLKFGLFYPNVQLISF
jgi:hypothetical protein